MNTMYDHLRVLYPGAAGSLSQTRKGNPLVLLGLLGLGQ